MSLIEPRQSRGKDCLNCKHHGFRDGIICNHPQRPVDDRVVIQWAKGCLNHQYKEPHGSA